jgi:hypothetical protein
LAPDATDDWVSIELLSEAQRGDILTWRLPTIQKGEDTGHVVTLAETPNLDTTGAFYTVRVYDSAAEAYFADTRAPSGAPSPKGATGVGSGVLNYKVDGTGRPIAYLFAPPLSAQYAYRTIAIGQAYEDPYSLRSREGMHRLLLESYRGYACTGPRASVRQLERNPDPWSGQRSTWTTGNIGHDRYQGVVHCREGSYERDFYPRLAVTNMQDMQYVITDGSSFVDLERDAAVTWSRRQPRPRSNTRSSTRMFARRQNIVLMPLGRRRYKRRGVTIRTPSPITDDG